MGRFATHLEHERLRAAFDDDSEMFASLVQYSDDAIVAKTVDGIVLSWNDGATRVYGFDADEMIGAPISRLIPPGEENDLPALIEKIVRGETCEHYDARRMRKDGAVIDVSVTVSPIKDARGRVVAVSSVARDVTAAKEASRQAEEYTRSLIEASLDPLVTISADGIVTDVNEATVKITGKSRAELVGSDFSDYFTEPRRAREGYQKAFAQGLVSDFPLTIRHKDGQLTDVLYNASVYKDTHGQVRGVFAAARDVTAQKRAEREVAEQRARELDRLAELERFQKLTVGRELKMIELKKEIEELKARRGESPS